MMKRSVSKKSTTKSSKTRKPTSGRRKYNKRHLRLYVAGKTSKSLMAFENLKKICEQYMPGQYEIEVIDLFENPQRAKEDQILAVPVLVSNFPAPGERILGDFSNTEVVLVGLNLKERA